MSLQQASALCLALLLCSSFSTYARSINADAGIAHRQLLGEKDHKYKVNDPVPLWASKVGPFANPRSEVDPCLALMKQYIKRIACVSDIYMIHSAQ